MEKQFGAEEGPINWEFRYQWIKALRSGKYRQSGGSLVLSLTLDSEGVSPETCSFCCLGVASYEYALRVPESTGYRDTVLRIATSSTTLSELGEVKDALGLRGSQGELLTALFIPCSYVGETCETHMWHRMHCEGHALGIEYLSLADMNDSQFTFEQIADFMLTNPESVFTDGNAWGEWLIERQKQD